MNDRLQQSVLLYTTSGCVPLIKKGTQLPASFSRTFTNSFDNQPAVQLALYRGEQPTPDQNELIGTFDLPVSRLPAGTASLQVTLLVDAEGTLRIKTYDLTSSEKHEFEAGIVK